MLRAPLVTSMPVEPSYARSARTGVVSKVRMRPAVLLRKGRPRLQARSAGLVAVVSPPAAETADGPRPIPSIEAARQVSPRGVTAPIELIDPL